MGRVTMTDKRRPTYFEMLDTFEREVLQATLESAGWNETVAAEALGLTLVSLQLKTEPLQILRRVKQPGGEW